MEETPNPIQLNEGIDSIIPGTSRIVQDYNTLLELYTDLKTKFPQLKEDNLTTYVMDKSLRHLERVATEMNNYKMPSIPFTGINGIFDRIDTILDNLAIIEMDYFNK